MCKNISWRPIFIGAAIIIILILSRVIDNSRKPPTNIAIVQPPIQLALNGDDKYSYTAQDRKTSKIVFAHRPHPKPDKLNHTTDGGSATSNKEEEPKWTDKIIAWFTIVLTISTIGLWRSTHLLWGAGKEQFQLIRKEFISTHRPRIVLREVDRTNGTICYMLVNIGNTEATIVEGWIILEELFVNHPIRNLRSFAHDDLGRLRFAPGEIKDLTIPPGIGDLFIRFPNAARIQTPEPQKSGEVHFTGAIVYEDSLGYRRRSVFRRSWHHGRQCFCRMDNPDYEYAD